MADGSKEDNQLHSRADRRLPYKPGALSSVVSLLVCWSSSRIDKWLLTRSVFFNVDHATSVNSSAVVRLPGLASSRPRLGSAHRSQRQKNFDAARCIDQRIASRSIGGLLVHLGEVNGLTQERTEVPVIAFRSAQYSLYPRSVWPLAAKFSLQNSESAQLMRQFVFGCKRTRTEVSGPSVTVSGLAQCMKVKSRSKLHFQICTTKKQRKCASILRAICDR